MSIELSSLKLDDKMIAYHSESVFLIQTGKGKKGGYRTKYQIVGNLPQAIMLYKGINIGNGYKKRLVCETFNKPLIARAWS